MSEIEDQRLLEELGRTQTVKDAQAAYNQIFDAQRQVAVRLKHARQNKQQIAAEIETFLVSASRTTG